MFSQIVFGFVYLGTSVRDWFIRSREQLAFQAAWVLLTWGIIGWAPRGWAISIGSYLLVYALLALIPALLKAAPPKSATLPKHPNDV